MRSLPHDGVVSNVSNNACFGYVFGGLALVCACSGQAFQGKGGDDAKGGADNTDAVTALPHGGSRNVTRTAMAGTRAEGGEEPDMEPPSRGGVGGVPGMTGTGSLTNTGTLPGGGGVAGSGAAGAGGGVSTAGGGVGGAGSAGSGGAVVVVDPPTPQCDSLVVEDWSQGLGLNSRWRVDFGDPVVDTVNHRLVLSYDDVAARNTELTGGYVIEADVTLVGGTVLTPYPYASELLLPSIRRSSTGTGIDLGSTQYGTTRTWDSAGWPGVAASIAGSNQVHVAMYVKNTSVKAEAVKVTYGGQVYRSNWATDFHWRQTNLGIVRYVGENNSAVFSSNSDRIYVGPLSGCEKLSDARVAALFDE